MFALLIALTTLIIDQLTKFIVLQNLKPGDSLAIIKNIFHLSLVCNRGAAFGLFAGSSSSSLLAVYICLIAAILIFAIYRGFSGSGRLRQIYLALILSGAIGNLIDRIRFGYVVDFIDLRIWPVFNVADTAITIGAGLLIVQTLKHKKTRKKISNYSN